MAPASIPEIHRRFITRPVPNADRAHRERFRDLPFQPIFIMGLHRSGTTFLYETLARILPVASLTVYDILFYPRLVTAFLEGSAEAEQASLDAYLQELGLGTRLLDEVKLSHDAVEEYGYVLQARRRSLKFSAWTRDLFDEMGRKLVCIHPGCGQVLLKNPWDLGSAAVLLKAYPGARFIYIRRNPIDTLNSQVKAAMQFTDGSPYAALLNKTLPVHRAGAAAFRLAFRLLGARRRNRFYLWGARRMMLQELVKYREGMAALPPASRCEVTYDELVRAPQETLRGIADFLGLEPDASLGTIESRPRNVKLLPEVEACRQAFEARIDPYFLKP